MDCIQRDERRDKWDLIRQADPRQCRPLLLYSLDEKRGMFIGYTLAKKQKLRNLLLYIPKSGHSETQQSQTFCRPNIRSLSIRCELTAKVAGVRGRWLII